MTTEALTPESSLAVRRALADASRAGTPVRITGGGTWLDAGFPVSAGVCVSTSALSGVVEYVPSDLVVTVGAGITLHELSLITAEHNQWLALEPFVSAAGATRATLGATIATASHGPLAGGYGLARDLVLGLSFVTGNGTAGTAGGRVVKNVAGFDLVRLMTGAFGTLGMITEVSVRLHARPAVDESFAIALDVPEAGDARERALARIVEQLNSPPTLAISSSLASLVLANGGLSTLIQTNHRTPAATVLLVGRAAGNAARVAAQRKAMAAFGTLHAVSGAVWSTIRTMDRGNVGFRVADAPLRTARSLLDVERWCRMVGVHDHRALLDPLRGVVRVTADVHAAAGLGDGGPLPDRSVAERLPAGWWHHVRARPNDDIAQGLRQRFDPAGILNPGIMGTTDATAGIG